MLSGTAPNLVFTPNIGWSGTTSFTFHVNDGQLSSAPAAVTITAQPTTSVPGTPVNLTAQAISSSQITLSWGDNSNNEDGFAVERANGSNWVQVGTVAGMSGPGTRMFVNTGLAANKS